MMEESKAKAIRTRERNKRKKEFKQYLSQRFHKYSYDFDRNAYKYMVEDPKFRVAMDTVQNMTEQVNRIFDTLEKLYYLPTHRSRKP